MAVKRRIIWLSDEDWEVLRESAKGHGWNVSEEIRQIWAYADKAADQEPIQVRTPEEKEAAAQTRNFWVAEQQPPVFRPVPKVAGKRIPRQK